MDINAALANMRRLVAEARAEEDSWSTRDVAPYADEQAEWSNVFPLAEQFAAIDEWLSAGGFQPAGWQR